MHHKPLHPINLQQQGHKTIAIPIIVTLLKLIKPEIDKARRSR
jgi:hypothetical protein